MMRCPQTSLKKLLSAVVCLLVIIELVFSLNIQRINADPSGATRGDAGDLWADIELGKRSFDEIMPYADAYHGKGGGVAVDRRTSPGKAYIFDGFFSRILGYDLSTCYALPNSQKCTPDLLIGQPSYNDYGSCNQHSSFQFSPDFSPASATTICSVPEYTHTTLEDKSYTGMYVDQSTGNLFVYDTLNNRVLEYYDPFNSDTIADQVWGQADFTGTKCNRTRKWGDPTPNPTSSSLCFLGDYTQGAAVTLDHLGNLWVADGGNARVLRFPNVDGTISKTADLVLGQSSFTTKDLGEGANQLWSPSSVQEGADGSIYVLTSSSNFIRRFDAPFTSGMNASAYILSTDILPNGSAYLSIDPTGNYFWTGTYDGFGDTYQKWSLDGTYQNISFNNWLGGTGSIGFDTLGNLLVPTSDITIYNYNSETNTYTEGRYFFRTWEGGPTPTIDRLRQGGWGGMVVTSTGQLLASDGRILYWNDPLHAADGQAASGWIGTTNVEDSGNFGVMAIDKDDRIYAERNGKSIEIYQGPVTNLSTPIKTLTAPFNLWGGGTVDIQNLFGGLVATDHGEYLWVSDPDLNRVMRIRGPLTSTPVVDIILGQTNSTNTSCNGGSNASPPALNIFCFPGSIGLDNFGNLYVSDHFFEISGNYRILMFGADLFPSSPANTIYNLTATKEFPAIGSHGNTTTPHATFQPAFDSTNRMVIGGNPYQGLRFVYYYNSPQVFNPSDPSDPTLAVNAGKLNDFYGWAFSITFDSSDNLYVYDTNRGKIAIYKQPFMNVAPVLTQITTIPSTTSDTTPSYSFHSSKAGSVSYAGGCDSSTSTVSQGNIIVTFNTLSLGTYNDCTITVTDSLSQASNVLSIPSFTVVAPPVVTEITPVADQNIDSTPSFSFNSTRAGTLSYGGSCSSATTYANAGDNTISLNTLADGTYNNCTITVTDSTASASNALHLSNFTIIARSHMLKSVGDYNGSGRVDLSDLSILASFWNQHSSAADANFDGNVNLSDLSILAGNWLRNY